MASVIKSSVFASLRSNPELRASNSWIASQARKDGIADLMTEAH